ncbi:hypothetical protein F4814DRAFT_411308 [Daldinia grandis]|nr:hypothetical protein F4814DRAFT_411308 [Daldinia grandis]
MMNKFKGNNCPDFKQVKEAIQFLLKEGPNTLKRRENSEIAQETTTEKQRTRLLQSLRFPSMNERKNDLADSYEETFRWVFPINDTLEEDYLTESNSDTSSDTSSTSWSTVSDYASEGGFIGPKDKPWYNFEDWLKSDNTLYWISGKPGSGKSTLVKYLIENPLTKEALAFWAKGAKGANNPMILSHFFWKAGSEKLQRNIKGCLCSILHQAVQPEMISLNSILTTYKSVLNKESVTDWSLKELKNVCFAVLRDYPSSICIFLDGLDEICLEDRSSLMELIETLRTFSNIKVCVASRPEPHLQSSLDNYPHLRLQDLTVRDMEKYAFAQIHPHTSNSQILTDSSSYITDLLVRKAEGVFLWLRLACDSFVRGLNNNDSKEILYQRLEEMPNDLYELYNDMWTRLNEDTKLYKETAARYFNLAIQIRRGRYSELSLLYLMAAANDKVQDIFVNARNSMEVASLKQECDKTLYEVRRRCTGLLEIVENPMLSTTPLYPTYDALAPYHRMSVRFLHRTAYDFLTDTEEGRRILAYDSSSRHELSFRLIKGDLVLRIFVNPRVLLHVGYYMYSLPRLIGVISQTAIDKFLKVMWDFYDNGYYTNILYRPPFLAIIAGIASKEFVLSGIANSPHPSLLATDVLRYMVRPRIHSSIDELDCFWEPLLALNADPSARGICYQLGPYDYSSTKMEVRSPIGFFVPQIFMDADDTQKGNARYRQLQRFLEAAPDLQERIPLPIVINKHEIKVVEWYNRTLAHITLDLDILFLVRAYSERARRNGLTLSTDRVLYQSPGNASKDTSPRIALIKVDDWKYYRCSSNKASGQFLLVLLIQFLFGDESRDLAQEANQEMDKIVKDISNKSIHYKKLDKRYKEFFAEENLGYCFVDEETGAMIPSDVYYKRAG